ncbi:AAA domain-containing protein [Rubrivivax sp. RP6-9]|uniref:AAA domain-containing protein n=1 Tax=Rubrivivax sp. RP6-9 TaxID=3415750 RepID=UPI003CC698D0
MDIKLIKKSGVPKAEVEAHQQIRREFSTTAFSKGWRGYASFAISRGGRGAGDDDFDLVLITHNVVIVVELKNWNGKLLESDGQKWYLDGESRDTSPVLKANLNAKRLASLMKQKLGTNFTPFVASFVVMHGNVKQTKLTPDEEKSVLTMTEFLALRYEQVYRDYFWKRPLFNPLDHLDRYDAFFEGPSFKPKDYLVDGFRPESDPIFIHPKKLYSEFRASAKDDPLKHALLRQWDFTALGLDLIGERDRPFVGLREQRVYEYVAEKNEELSLSLMRPISRKADRDVTLDFTELYALPGRVTRLAEFTHSVLPKLSADERLSLVKAVLHKFGELHALNVAHRDIGDHSVWVDRSSKVVMSGFPAAYYPEMKTVGAFRDKVKVEQSVLPEDGQPDTAATPYRRDVFMLGALAHLVLFGERPPKPADIYAWSDRADAGFSAAVTEVIRKALSPAASERYPNAREMLEALNAATTDAPLQIVDVAAFDSYRANSKERDYSETDLRAETKEYLCFRSTTEDGDHLVKVWYGVEPDPRKPDRSLRLLSFLERARVVKGMQISGLHRVVDFGLSRGSLLLVTEWVEGQPLSAWLLTSPTYEARMQVARSLVGTLLKLHAVELSHGDIHPDNVVVRSSGDAVLVDVLDFRRDQGDAYTTAYLPDNYKSLTPSERDRYSLAAVLVEVLDSSRSAPTSGSLPIPRVYEELANLLDAQTLSTLDPLSKALEKVEQGEKAEAPHFTVVVPNLAYSGVPAGALRSDNGAFHIAAQRDRQSEGRIRLYVTGVGRQLTLIWNPGQEAVESVKASSVSQSQLLRSQMMRDASVRMEIELAEGPAAEAQDLVLFLLDDAQLKRRLPATESSKRAEAKEVTTDPELEPADASVDDLGPVPVRELWQTLLDAEEDAFFTVTVAGEKRHNPERSGQLLIPYHADSGVLNYEPPDEVVVESQTNDGVWKPCGQLNLRDTTVGAYAELAIDQPHLRANFKIGSRLRLMSTNEKASFTRRRFAVERILQDKAVVPDLISYFEASPSAELSPQKFSAPSDQDLEVYSEHGKSLNPSQREAFKRVLGNGPVSLLQGPPGTGKTWFIASLLHYLMTKEGARRILLVSQAHEAVNNALEKGMEVCRTMGVDFNAVRLGAESVASDEIRHLHASSIENAYRESFKAEQKERIVELASAFGLPKGYAAEVVELHLRIGMLCDRIATLQARTGREDERSVASLDARVRALTESLYDIAADFYQVDAQGSPIELLNRIRDGLAEKYEVRSQDAISRLLRVIKLSEEWVAALGSSDANFAEFLAKSRTVVAGTLVGVGYRGAGVVQNIYDWVIIDEAGRAAPSELAVAMQAGHRILLVGDHLQLPPTFSDQVREAVRERYGVADDSTLLRSDFERLFNSAYGQQVGTTLLSQYRMAPDIGELVSECFYGGQLETGRGAPPEYYDLLPAHLSKEVTWVDTSTLGRRGYEQQSDARDDTWNTAEAHVVMELLRQIIESDEFMAFMAEDLKPQEPPIGIICMYSRQRSLIDKLKAEAPWLGSARRLVKVDTVDSYQGKENRIVILSTVRNNPDGRIGFLRSPNRVNVAMSRAMERLFVVGASKLWQGRHAEAPLGRVLKYTKQLAEQGRAVVIPAEQLGEGV